MNSWIEEKKKAEKAATRPNAIEFEVWGDQAMFSDPLIKIGGESVSYPVPTYEALKGITKNIYWKPDIIWFVDAVRVMNPIRFYSTGMRLIKPLTGGNDLANYTFLSNVRYQVRAHFEFNYNRPELENDWNENKHYLLAKRYLSRGGKRNIFLGTTDCQALVRPCRFGSGTSVYDNTGEIQYGTMFHSFTYPDEAYSEETRGVLTRQFYAPVIKNGIITMPRPEECLTHEVIGEMAMKEFENNRNCLGLEDFDERLYEELAKEAALAG